MSDLPDRLLAGRYRLSTELGRGGMGVVWHAHDELLGRDVAVKEILLPPTLNEATRSNLCERALREARAAAQLDHPAIIDVYDVIVEDQRPWIVMRLVQGRSLDQTVRADGPLRPERAARIGLDVLAGLTVAHGKGILHRDVTPRNVLLSDDGPTILTDFGIAAITGATELTQTGGLIGSPGYMAPERLHGHQPGPESDLWSLGATLYFAVEGRAAYQATDPAAMIAAVVTREPAAPAQAGQLAPVLLGLLAKDPAARVRADAAHRGLEAVANGWAPAPTAIYSTAVPAPRPVATTDPALAGSGHPPGPRQFPATYPGQPGRVTARKPGPRRRAATNPPVIIGAVALLLFVAFVVLISDPGGIIADTGKFSAEPTCTTLQPTSIPDHRFDSGPSCSWSGYPSENWSLQVKDVIARHGLFSSAPAKARSLLLGSTKNNSYRSVPGIGAEAFILMTPGDTVQAEVRFRVSNINVDLAYTRIQPAMTEEELKTFTLSMAARIAAQLQSQ